MAKFIVNEFVNQEKSLGVFGRSIRAGIRGLWLGQLSIFEFVDTMRATIERGFRVAWAEGAAQCGIEMGDLTPEEIKQLELMINSQFQYLVGFGLAIQDGSKANGGALEPLLTRGEMWVNRYNEVRIKGAAMACANLKVVWRLGKTEKHCASCLGFDGRVYRYSTWEANGALPQSQSLGCGGWRCDCNLEPTQNRITPGPFPRALLGKNRRAL